MEKLNVLEIIKNTKKLLDLSELISNSKVELDNITKLIKAFKIIIKKKVDFKILLIIKTDYPPSYYYNGPYDYNSYFENNEKNRHLTYKEYRLVIEVLDWILKMDNENK